MKFHMHAYGIFWTLHGESLILAVVVADNVRPTKDMTGVKQDVMDERMETEPGLDKGKLGTKSSGIRDDSEDLVKEVQSEELYPGCTKFTSVDFLSKLMDFKMENKWSNSSFDELLELLQFSLPKGNKIPSSYYEAKKTLEKYSEQQYKKSKVEFDSHTKPNREGDHGESSASHSNDVSVFEKVMGAQSGHTRGGGHKPLSTTPSFVGHHVPEETPPAFTQAQIENLVEGDKVVE